MCQDMAPEEPSSQQEGLARMERLCRLTSAFWPSGRGAEEISSTQTSMGSTWQYPPLG